MTMPVDRRSANAFDHTDESVIAPPLARGDHSTDENPFAAAQSPPTEPVGESHAPESFEELETRDANKFTEQELAMARDGARPVVADDVGASARRDQAARQLEVGRACGARRE